MATTSTLPSAEFHNAADGHHKETFISKYVFSLGS